MFRILYGFKRRYFPFLLCFVLACSHDNASRIHEASNELIVSVENGRFPSSIHPTLSFGYPYHHLLYAPLSTINTFGKQVPILLDSLPWISKEGDKQIYSLRKDMYWEDKNAVSHFDIEFTYKVFALRNAIHRFLWPISSALKGFKWIDQNDLSYELIVEPSPSGKYMSDYISILNESFYDPDLLLRKYRLEDLKKYSTESLPAELKRWIDKYKNYGHFDKNGELIGIYSIGPYNLKNGYKGESLTFQAKENYWAQKVKNIPLLSNNCKLITFVDDSPELAIRREGVDISRRINVRTKVKDGLPYYEYLMEGNFYYCLFFNLALDSINNSVTNLATRQALAQLIPTQQIIYSYFKDSSLAEIICSPVSTDLPEYNSNLEPWKFNPENAKAIFHSQGWADSDRDGYLEKEIEGRTHELELRVLIRSGSSIYATILRLWQEKLSKAGVKLKARMVDRNNFLKMIQERNYDATILNLSYQRPINDYSQVWSSDSPNNFSGFGNDYSDSLINSIQKARLDSNRIKLSQDFQQLLKDSLPAVFLFRPKEKMILHKRLGKQEIGPYYPYLWINKIQLK